MLLIEGRLVNQGTLSNTRDTWSNFSICWSIIPDEEICPCHRLLGAEPRMDTVRPWSCPVSVSVLLSWSNTMTKRNVGEGRVYVGLQRSGHTPPLGEVGTGTQGRKLEVGAEAEAIEEHCWLACLVCFLRPSSRPRGSTTHSGPAPPTSIIQTSPLRFACRSVLWRNALNFSSSQSSFFQDTSRFGSSWWKPTSTVDSLSAWHTSRSPIKS